MILVVSVYWSSLIALCCTVAMGLKSACNSEKSELMVCAHSILNKKTRVTSDQVALHSVSSPLLNQWWMGKF